MSRLTKRVGEHVYYTHGKYPETIPAECETADVRTILRALAAYEDTGLEPDQIAAMIGHNAALVEALSDKEAIP